MTAGLPAPPLSTTPAAVTQATMRGLDRRAGLIWAPSILCLVMSVIRHLPGAPTTPDVMPGGHAVSAERQGLSRST